MSQWFKPRSEPRAAAEGATPHQSGRDFGMSYKEDVKGIVMCSKKRQRGGSGPVQRVGRKKRRTWFAHIAFICDHASNKVVPSSVRYASDRLSEMVGRSGWRLCFLISEEKSLPES